MVIGLILKNFMWWILHLKLKICHSFLLTHYSISLFRAFRRSMAGASTSLGTFSNKSKSTSSYKMSKNKRDKKQHRKKSKLEDNDPEAANEFLLSGQNGYVADSSPNSSPNESLRGRKRPKDTVSMAEELV